MNAGLSISAMRLLLRAANAFTLDVFHTLRGQRDFTDALLMMAMATRDGPISVNALSVSLGLSFETVRRRVKALVAAGCCEAGPDGVRLAAGYLSAPSHAAVLSQTYAATRTFYLRLRDASCLPRFGSAAAVAASPGSAPEALLWRAVSEYVLRLMEFLLPNFPGPGVAFVILAVVRANTQGMSDEVRGADGFDAAAFVSDDLRQPAKASEIAALLGLPYETVRRHLMWLVADGRCHRVAGGFVVPAAVLARPNMIAALGANSGNFSRLLGALSEAGIVARWDSEAPSTALEVQAQLA